MAHSLNCPTVKLRAVGNFLSDCCANPQHSKTKTLWPQPGAYRDKQDRVCSRLEAFRHAGA